MTADGEPDAQARSRQRRGDEDVDLSQSLTGLSRLAASRMPLEQMLTRVARYAVQAIPGADGAGLTLIEHDRADTIVTTADFVRAVDAIQYGIGEGPCITAARDSVTVLSGSLGDDPRWSRFGARVARMGVHSALSLPLLTPDEVIGAMNVYAHAVDAFDHRAAELGEIFAVPAAVAVQNARVLEETRRLATRLQSTLDQRVIVERAVGIIISRSGVDEEEALARLTKLARHQDNDDQRHVKLVEIAQSIIDEAVRRARGNPSS